MAAIYTYSEARQNLATLLDTAAEVGEVKIKRRDGQTFVLRPEIEKKSPLDVEGIYVEGITEEEILDFIKEGRSKYE